MRGRRCGRRDEGCTGRSRSTRRRRKTQTPCESSFVEYLAQRGEESRRKVKNGDVHDVVGLVCGGRKVAARVWSSRCGTLASKVECGAMRGYILPLSLRYRRIAVDCFNVGISQYKSIMIEQARNKYFCYQFCFLSCDLIRSCEHRSRRSRQLLLSQNSFAPMTTERFQFRVLIIGRANAGKTSILQRICETTNSPIIYRGYKMVRDLVRDATF